MTEKKPTLYLWLNSRDGWQRFGPFDWLRHDDKRRTLREQDGEIVSRWDFDDHCWRVELEGYEGHKFHDLLLTTTERNPHDS